jgi:hypothetical protein
LRSFQAWRDISRAEAGGGNRQLWQLWAVVWRSSQRARSWHAPRWRGGLVVFQRPGDSSLGLIFTPRQRTFCTFFLGVCADRAIGHFLQVHVCEPSSHVCAGDRRKASTRAAFRKHWLASKQLRADGPLKNKGSEGVRKAGQYGDSGQAKSGVLTA